MKFQLGIYQLTKLIQIGFQDLDYLLEKYLEPLANTTFLHSSEVSGLSI